MGTRFNIVIPGIESFIGEKLAMQINLILEREEQLLSCYEPHSEIGKINKLAAKEPVVVSDQMAEIISLLDAYWKRTNGAFDAGLLNYNLLLKKNNFTGNTITDEIFGWKSVVWNPGERTIRFQSEATGIDTGGFGKGWALEKIIKLFKDNNIKSAFISFGESSITAIGTHPFGDFWPVTIAHPVSGQELEIELADASISISGLMVKTTDGIANYAPHIISAKNGAVMKQNNLAIVKCSSPFEAEILSTAAFSLGETGISELKNRFNDAAFYFLK